MSRLGTDSSSVVSTVHELVGCGCSIEWVCTPVRTLAGGQVALRISLDRSYH